MDGWEGEIQQLANGVVVERIPFYNASTLPRLEPQQAAEADFQIVQIPLRGVLGEGMYFGVQYHDDAAYQQLFEAACDLLDRNVAAALEYNRQFGICTFVLNFFTPQQNPMGRLQDRYALSNMVFFVEELNRRLYALVSTYRNAFVIDLEQIVSNLGKRYLQDDSVHHLNHASLLRFIGMAGDHDRLEAIGDLQAVFAPRAEQCIRAIWHEAVAGYRSLQQKDSIKLVIFDLDDTMWRGVAADTEMLGPAMTEGWPTGLLEVVSYLWRRGILVAIVSKNDEQTALRTWNELYGTWFDINHFVARRISWAPKVDGVRDILSTVNVLPDNVLFVDDNPVERASVQAAFPGIRVLDAPLAQWRRILLWSAELQPAVVTQEAADRTSMVQAHIHRDEDRSSVDRAMFLRSLGVTVEVHRVDSPSDARYDRCLELLNKTNQFNTTGVRWKHVELETLFNEGGYLLAGGVQDRYTAYGDVGIIVIRGNTIEQFVMSCRIFGMDVEHACVAVAVKTMRSNGTGVIRASLRDTGKNRVCLDLYKELGFVLEADDVWSFAPASLMIPEHITCTGGVPSSAA